MLLPLLLLLHTIKSLNNQYKEVVVLDKYKINVVAGKNNVVACSSKTGCYYNVVAQKQLILAAIANVVAVVAVEHEIHI